MREVYKMGAVVNKKYIRLGVNVLAVVLAVVAIVLAPRMAGAEKIRDVAHLKNEVPNELVGMGLVTGLKGTGDGGDFLPAMRPLKEVMKRFDNPTLEKELKNANDVAIVMLSCKVPEHGAHAGQVLDVKVSAVAAKSLKGGRLLIVPLFAPTPDHKMVLGSASGALALDDEALPTQATIRGGGVLIEDILSDSLQNNILTLVLDPAAASYEMASVMADQINEEAAPLTNGKAIAIATDASSVLVKIPAADQANPAPFISFVLSRSLPNLPEPAVVRIDMARKLIIFTEEVELAPTLISLKNLTISVSGPGPTPPGGGREPFVALDTNKAGNAKLKDLAAALNLLKVSPEDRVDIIVELNKAHVLKAKLIIE